MLGWVTNISITEDNFQMISDFGAAIQLQNGE
jgi:hypothetical protein